jgi:hypothetical protein
MNHDTHKNAARAKWIAALFTAVFASFIAWILLDAANVWSSRYDGEIIVSLPGLAALTLFCAIPGALALAMAMVSLQRKRVCAWMVAGLLGALAASAAATTLAFAADCVPQCRGSRGSLAAGLMLAFPAGFGVGTMVYITWLWTSKALIAAIVDRKIA